MKVSGCSNLPPALTNNGTSGGTHLDSPFNAFVNYNCGPLFFLQLSSSSSSSSSSLSAKITAYFVISQLSEARFMEKTKDHRSEDHFRSSPLLATSDGTSSLSEPFSASQSPSSSDHSTFFTENGKPAAGRSHKKKPDRKASSFAYRIREHVKMGPKFSETVKGKLSVGAKIIKRGGRENIFRDIFGASDGEKLLKASQCYLSTTAGPIAGILFISSQKVAFCSERSIAVHSSAGGLIRIPYKLSIPVKKIKEANESEHVNNPLQKYIEIVTEDNFEFWFMGFVRYEKAMMNLQRAISMLR